MTRERTAHLVHLDEERFSATTGTGRAIVYGGDIPANDLSPVEMIVVSLAACSAMDVIGIVRKKRQAIDRYEVHVTAVQRDEYPQILTEMSVTGGILAHHGSDGQLPSASGAG